MPNSPLLRVPPATVLRWRSASSFVPADQLAEEMGPWDHHCCRCCDFAWSWLDIRLDIYSILIWVDSLLLWILTQTRRLRGGKAAQDVPRTEMRQAEVCSFSACYSLLQLCRLCGNRGNAWLEASFGGSGPPSLKSSPISRCREPAHAKNFGRTGRRHGARHDARWLIFGATPWDAASALAQPLSITKPRIPRLQQLYALSAR